MRVVLCLVLLLFVNGVGAKTFDVPITVDSRIKTFIYNPNEIYSLNLKLNFQTIIEFSYDESVELISVGDPFPWKLTPIDRRLFIKPLQVGVRTNLTIITNKRTYLFDITSDSTSSLDDFDVIHVVRFFYPKVPLDESKYQLDDFLNQKAGNQGQTVEESKGLTQRRVGNTDFAESYAKNVAVNLNYSFAGEYNPVTPLEVFDDRKDTFIRFKNNNINLKIYSVEESGKRRLVKTKKVGDFVVIAGVHAKLHLKMDNYENVLYNDLRVNKAD